MSYISDFLGQNNQKTWQQSKLIWNSSIESQLDLTRFVFYQETLNKAYQKKYDKKISFIDRLSLVL